MLDKEKARDEIKRLVERFKENLSQYRNTSYKEAQVRTEFIDKSSYSY